MKDRIRKNSLVLLGLFLGTVAVGALAEPAEAFNRRRRARSSRGFDETGIDSLFSFVTVDIDGSTIGDGNSDNNVGYFSNALADYVTFSPSITSGVLTGAGSVGSATPIETVSSFSSFEGLITAIEATGITTNNSGPLDLRASRVATGIQYNFIDATLTDPVVDVTIPFSSSFSSDLSGFSASEQDKLINDLPFIVDNFDWRFLQEDPTADNDAQSFIGEAVFIEEIADPVSTPEPGAFLGLFLSAMAGFGMKQHRQSEKNS